MGIDIRTEIDPNVLILIDIIAVSFCHTLAKLRKNESNAKEKLVFLYIAECIVTSVKPKLRKNERKAKWI